MFFISGAIIGYGLYLLITDSQEFTKPALGWLLLTGYTLTLLAFNNNNNIAWQEIWSLYNDIHSITTEELFNMIITNNVNEIEMGNVEAGSEFKIKNSAKAFSILSSGLYSNKIRAIIRELSCNAVDGHTVVNKQDVPFDVHLPSRMEPHFSVRDYGVGLSHDSVMSMYTTYFDSSKTGSNDLIGGLGLGSKSPFSYTNNFTVASIKDGIRNVYTAYIDDMGVPSITRLLTEDSSDESGVEVSFAVEEDDIYKFREEAQYVFATFAVHPNVIGTYYKKDIEYHVENIIDGVHHYKSNTFANGGAMAIMGNVAYPINVPNAQQNLGDLAQLLDNSLLIKFDIGSLDIQASREHLSYIPSTIKSIKDKLKEISDGLLPIVKEKILGETNAWARVAIINNLCASSLFSSTTREYVKTSGLPFTDTITGKAKSSFRLFQKQLKDKFNIELIVYQRGYRKVNLIQAQYDYNNNSPITENSYYYNVDINESVKFIVADGIKGLRQRTKSYCNNAGSRNTLYVMMQADKTIPALYNEFLTAIYNPYTITENDLPEYKTTSREKIAYDAFFQSYRSKGRFSDSFQWTTFEFDEEDDTIHYYMPLNNKNIVSPKFGTVSLDSYMNTFSHTGIESIDNAKVIGVRKSGLPAIEGMKNWINFETYMENIARFAIKQSGGIFAKFAKQQDIFFNKLSTELMELVNDKSPLKVAYNKFANVESFESAMHIPSTQNVYVLSRKFDLGVDVDLAVDKHKKSLYNVVNRYPLLASVVRENPKAVAEYINLIDTHKGV